MKNNESLSVREIQLSDIDLIVNYWEDANPKYLLSLGVDPKKRLNGEALKKVLTEQIRTPLRDKLSYTLIWELNRKCVGHSNIGKQLIVNNHIIKTIKN